jgi:hypothetical protein
VRLEEPIGYIGENNPCSLLIQVLNPQLYYFAWFSLLKSKPKQFFEVTQRVLVHWIDSIQTTHNKVEDSASDCDWHINVSRYIEFLFDLRSGLYVLDDFSRISLGYLQSLYQHNIIENHTCRHR